MRARLLLVAILTTAATAGPAAADHGDGDGGAGSIVGLGFGPSASVSGGLADHFTGEGGSGRLRLGGRVLRYAFELTTSFAGLHGDDLDQAFYMLATPTLGYYPIVTPHLQLAVRAGLGYGSIGGERTAPPPPCVETPCDDDGRESIQYPGYGLDLGATAAIHLGRRRGNRLVLWADAGLSMVRFQLPAGVVDGKLFILTIGFGHGHEL